MRLFTLLLFLTTFMSSSASSDTAAAKNHGIPFDLQAFVDNELQSGKKHIVIPSGRYRVTPHKRMHLRFENLHDIEIVAKGVELICTETTRALTINKCSNLHLTGLTIDYDPLPFTQGKIINISQDGLVHDIELFDGYPTNGKISGLKYEIYRADTRTLRFGSYHGCEVTQPTPTSLRVVKPPRWKNKAIEQVGDIIAIDCLQTSTKGSIPHALSIHDSQHVTLDSVSIYSSPMFGFIEDNCTSNTYRNCVVDRRPLSTDLKKRASARIRSLNADAFHSYNAPKGPSYLSCRAKFQGDDCIAINGEYHLVVASEGNKLRVIARRHFNMERGDRAQILSYSGERLPDAKVLKIEKAKDATEIEKDFLLKQGISKKIKTAMHKAYTVTLDRPITLPMGSLICSTNKLGSGFRILDGDFGFTRSRGLLIQSCDGEISGNTLEACQGESIKIEPEYWWLAAGCSNDIVIKNNRILHSNKTAIHVVSKSGTRDLSPAGAHQRITITDNTISHSPTPQIYVTSTESPIIKNNTLILSEEAAQKNKEPITLKKCQNVKVTENTIRNEEEK